MIAMRMNNIEFDSSKSQKHLRGYEIRIAGCVDFEALHSDTINSTNPLESRVWISSIDYNVVSLR